MILTVTIQHCINCDHHKWCSQHDAKKYRTYFEELKGIIEKKVSGVIIKSNVLPEGYKKLGKDSKIYNKK